MLRSIVRCSAQPQMDEHKSLVGTFLRSCPTVNHMPKEWRPEYAFAGRSNVGKSSLINALLGGRLAKTAARPGKTLLLNCFDVNNAWRIVDMPGYGWARVSKRQRWRMRRQNENYLLCRENLACLFMMIDARLPLQQADEHFMRWLGEKAIPFAVVLTKVDKLSKQKTHAQTQYFRNIMADHWTPPPVVLRTSAVTGEGKDALMHFINRTNARYHRQRDLHG